MGDSYFFFPEDKNSHKNIKPCILEKLRKNILNILFSVQRAETTTYYIMLNT